MGNYSDSLSAQHTTQLASKFALDFINEVCSSSLCTSCLSSCKQHTHTHTLCEFIYHPTRPADGMLPTRHMSTAACRAVYGVSAKPHTSANMLSQPSDCNPSESVRG